MTPGDLLQLINTVALSPMDIPSRRALAELRYAGHLSRAQSWKTDEDHPIAALGMAVSGPNLWSDPRTLEFDEDLLAAMDPNGQLRTLYPELYQQLLHEALSIPWPIKAPATDAS